MLEFRSGDTRAVNAVRAVDEVLDLADPDRPGDFDLVLVYSAVGHDLTTLSDRVRQRCPGARVLAASCAGVIGRDGPGETLHDVAVMGLRGDGFVVAHVDGLVGATSYVKGVELGAGLAADGRTISMVYLLASGIDIANDRLIAGVESVLGPDVVIFGGTSSDQMKGLATFQAADGVLYQHSAFAVGLCDPTLRVDTQASHGFVAVGDEMVVTAADGNRILELDGRPAWHVFLEHLGLPPTATEAHTIPIGALAEELTPALAAEYGNDHILRVVTHHTADGAIVYPTECAVGTRLRITERDEERIFHDMDRVLAAMSARGPGAAPVAVFQADCLARGRRLFNVVMKEELVHRIQRPFSDDGVVPPWFGLYGFGEYARLDGRNEFHNYTTALAALYRVA